MTRWDSDNVNAAHTQRELEQECRQTINCEIGSGNVFADLGFKNADLMALQSDNKGLRARIEQLERELADLKALSKDLDGCLQISEDIINAASNRLTKGKREKWGLWYLETIAASRAAYRKARGL